MRFQANPDEYKITCNEVNLHCTTQILRPGQLLLVKTGEKRLDDKKYPVHYSLTRNEPKEMLKKQ
jgi:hypothetical protein